MYKVPDTSFSLQELGIAFAALKQKQEDTDAKLKDTDAQLKALGSAVLDGVSFQYFENIFTNVSPPPVSHYYFCQAATSERDFTSLLASQ